MKSVNYSSEVLFSETQRFRQWWIWLIMLGSTAAVGIEPLRALRQQLPADANGITACVLVLLINALLFITKLETGIGPDGIYVRFFPFHRKFRYFSWSEVAQISVRQYHPIGEYGGWGLRFGMGNGRAYSISGNQGIQLVFSNGSKLLIGTRQPDEVAAVLRQLGNR